MTYYRIEESIHDDGYWVVGINDEHAQWLWHLRRGFRIADTGEAVPIEVNDGAETPFALGFYQVPVVSLSLAQELVAVAPDDLQILPAKLSNGVSGFVILNILHVLDVLIPELASRWELSQPSSSPLRRERIRGHQIFRILNSPAVVVSQAVWNKITQAGVRNIHSEPVSFLPT